MILGLSSSNNAAFPSFRAFSTFSLTLLSMVAPTEFTESNVENYYGTARRLLTTRYHSYIIR